MMSNKSYKDAVLKKWASVFKTVDEKEEYKNQDVVRVEPVLLTGGNHCFISSTIKRNMSVMVEMTTESLQGFDLPKFAGVKIAVEKHKKINPLKDYLTIRREDCCNEELFIAFTATLIDGVSHCKNDNECAVELVEVLEKYRRMFSKESSQMSKEEEQGLFCELAYLNSLIDRAGDSVVGNWAGFEGNKHDFVFADYSVEVKSTVNQKQVIIHISNENQLSDEGIGALYLKTYRVEYGPEGTFIQDLIEEICAKITSAEMYMRFISALLTKGIDRDVFKSKRSIRVLDEFTYKVDEKFPRITRMNMPAEAFGLDYNLNITGVEIFEESGEFLL